VGERTECLGSVASVRFPCVASVSCPPEPFIRRPGEVWGIEVFLACDANQREQRITPCISKRRAHPAWRCHFGKRAYRPVRGNPFPRRVGEHRGQRDRLRGLIDRGRLHGGDLMMTLRLAHDVEATRQGRVAVRPGSSGRLVATLAVSDFSRLASVTWALASAAARAEIDSLDGAQRPSLDPLRQGRLDAVTESLFR
jgi:hypothetical protein